MDTWHALHKADRLIYGDYVIQSITFIHHSLKPSIQSDLANLDIHLCFPEILALQGNIAGLERHILIRGVEYL